MANRRFIDFPIAASVGDNDIVLIWQDGLNKQTTKATLLQGSPQSLAGLTDVDISALTNGQILQYNSTTSKWENVDRTDINLSELGDVTIVAPANGQVLVYNSSTSKWENSSAGYVPYTGAVTTVNLGAQSILAGSFVKAGGTSSQFLKADGSVDSTAYGTGSVTSVALTMPSAFSVGGSPITTAGTLAVTGAGTVGQYIRGDGSLETFPSLTGFVPYTGATADVNLGTHDLAAERGTFANNGSSDTLTVNHTSGSGYGIIVTKGGNNEALYVSKTSGSGNAMTVVGGRTSLVDLALSSVTNTAGDFLTLSGGVVHKRTAAQTLTDIGGQAALTNPVTGTGTSGQVAYFTGTSAISSESNLFWDATNDRLGIGINSPAVRLHVLGNGHAFIIASDNATQLYTTYKYNTNTDVGYIGNGVGAITGGAASDFGIAAATGNLLFATGGVTERMRIFSNGNVFIGSSPTDAGFKLDVNGTGRFSGRVTIGNDVGYALTYGRYSAGIPISYLRAGTDSTGGFRLTNHNGADVIVVNGSNAITLDGALSVTGAATFSSTLTFSGLLTSLKTSGEVFAATSATTGSLYQRFQNSGSQFFFGIDNSTGSDFGGGNYSANIYSGSNVNLNFATNNAIRLTITGGGNVLIGTTTNDGAKLRVEGGELRVTTSNSGVALYQNSGVGEIAAYNWGGNAYIPLVHVGSEHRFNTSATERMRITSGGNVGIGTTSPNLTAANRTVLDINGTNNSLLVFSSGGTYKSYIYNDGVGLTLQAATLQFETSFIPRIHITSGGNVLIGTTTNGASRLRIVGLPTSSAGLSSGDVWSDSGTLKIA